MAQQLEDTSGFPGRGTTSKKHTSKPGQFLCVNLDVRTSELPKVIAVTMDGNPFTIDSSFSARCEVVPCYLQQRSVGSLLC